MSYDNIRYTMADLLSRFGLHTDESGWMTCPWCHGKKKLHVDFDEDRWNCVICSDKGGGVFHFFAAYVNNETLGKKPSFNDRLRIRKQMIEYMGDDQPNPPPRPKAPPRPAPPKIPVAPDSHVCKVYEAMLDIPALQLLPKHKENLLRRGLSEEAILKNQYRSIPDWYSIPECYVDMFKEEGGNKLRTSHKEIRKMNAREVQMGLMIAHHIESRGLSLQGVPGFFKFGKRWCYWVLPGMLIPTRNSKGEIVLFQCRRDGNNGAKYITMSKASLPEHVNDSVSRTHFPLANAPIQANIPVLLTEGPLKADIACYLHGKPVVFLAIPGITTTKDLLDNVVPILKSAGIKKIHNAFDMDRLTNKNVRKGTYDLFNALKKRKIKFEDVFWDEQYAAFKKASLLLLARTRNVPVKIPPHLPVHAEVDIIAAALDDAKISHSTFKDAKGNDYNLFWDSKTKGIDDFYLLREKKRRTRSA